MLMTIVVRWLRAFRRLPPADVRHASGVGFASELSAGEDVPDQWSEGQLSHDYFRQQNAQ